MQKRLSKINNQVYVLLCQNVHEIYDAFLGILKFCSNFCIKSLSHRRYEFLFSTLKPFIAYPSKKMCLPLLLPIEFCCVRRKSM